jgi:hypothetical protein
MNIDPVTVIAKTVQLWLVVRPIRTIRNRRRAKRGLPPLTDEDAMKGETLRLGVLDENGNVVRELNRDEPIIDARTSVKSLVGGTFLAQVYVQLVGLLPYDGLVAALTTPEMIALVSVGLTALVARFTKSPLEPGKV